MQQRNYDEVTQATSQAISAQLRYVQDNISQIEQLVNSGDPQSLVKARKLWTQCKFTPLVRGLNRFFETASYFGRATNRQERQMEQVSAVGAGAGSGSSQYRTHQPGSTRHFQPSNINPRSVVNQIQDPRQLQQLIEQATQKLNRTGSGSSTT
jgi:hypothetical protein